MSTSGLALVTGASSGIGAELALLLAADGFDLLLTAEEGLGGDGLEPVAVRCRTAGVEVQTVRADLRTDDGVRALHDAVEAQHPQPALRIASQSLDGLDLGGRGVVFGARLDEEERSWVRAREVRGRGGHPGRLAGHRAGMAWRRRGASSGAGRGQRSAQGRASEAHGRGRTRSSGSGSVASRP